MASVERINRKCRSPVCCRETDDEDAAPDPEQQHGFSTDTPQLLVMFSPDAELAGKSSGLGVEEFARRLTQHLDPSFVETAPSTPPASNESEGHRCSFRATLMTKYYSAKVQVVTAEEQLSRQSPEAVVFVVGEEEGAPLLNVDDEKEESDGLGLQPLNIMRRNLRSLSSDRTGCEGNSSSPDSAEASWVRTVPLKFCVWIRKSTGNAACISHHKDARLKQETSFVRVFLKDVFVECLEICCCELCNNSAGSADITDSASPRGEEYRSSKETVFAILADSLRNHMWPGMKRRAASDTISSTQSGNAKVESEIANFDCGAFEALASSVESFKLREKNLSWGERRTQAMELASKLADLLGSEGEEDSGED